MQRSGRSCWGLMLLVQYRWALTSDGIAGESRVEGLEVLKFPPSRIAFTAGGA